MFSSLSVATGWGMRYGAEEACPMCILGFWGDWMAVSAIHARERRAIHKRGQRGAPMTLNMNYGIKRPPADNVSWASGRAALNIHNVTKNRQSRHENMLFAAH